MNTKSLLFACFLSFSVGIIFFAYMQEIIIIRRPVWSTQNTPTVSAKKEVTLFFWHRKSWHSEKRTLIWYQDLETNITQLVNSLLELLQEEHIWHKKVVVQSVLIPSTSKIVYLSFDRNPFCKEYTTYSKWFFIESILKTIKENDCAVDAIQFLVSHTPLHDHHLDFSKPWPISGFSKALQ